MPRPHIQVEIEYNQKGKAMVSKVAYDELLEEFKTLNADLVDLRHNKGALLTSEVQEMGRIRQEHLEMKQQLDYLTVFVRENYRREIDLGQHANMVSVVDVAAFYMGRERVASNRKWWQLW